MKQIGGHEMRVLGSMIEDQIPGLGFALIVFPFGDERMSNYISNAQREDMIKALEETVIRFKKQQEFPTPETN
jgi:hypothetical protein